MWRADVHSCLALVIDPLEGVVVGVAFVEALLAEVEIAADLTVVAWAVNGTHLASTATVETRERE